MIFYEPITVGLNQLRANKLRSFLTLLGIVIGVASVIGIVSLGEGLRGQVMGEFAQSGGATMIHVNPPRQWIQKDGRWVQRPWQEFLTNGDLSSFFAETEQLRTSVPTVGGSAQLQYGKTTVATSFIGTSEQYSIGFNWPAVLGRSLSADDIRQTRRVCVIGGKIFKDLFQSKNPLDKEIKLNGERYTVIGVLEERIRFGNDEGNTVLVPYTTVQKRVTGKRQLHSATLFVETIEAVGQVSERVQRVLRRNHEHGDEFQVETSQDQMESANNTIRIMESVAGGIAGISLLVGGIGIMNIMMVSVTERTREIGVRKALGAKPRDILFQFLAEAVVLSMAGGALGIVLGMGFGQVIEQVISVLAPGAPFTSAVGMESVFWAITFAASVGIFFGVYPAARASRLDPVEALHYE